MSASIPQPEPQDEFLTPEEVAKRLRMTRRKVLEHSKGQRPKIPCLRVNRVTIRYHWPSVIEALSKGKSL